MNARTVSSWSSLLVLLLVAGKQHFANAMETSRDFVTSECVTGLFRLPTRVQPVNYILHICPDIKKGSFQGHVEIELKIGKMESSANMNDKSIFYEHLAITRDPTKIILNAENLVITGLKFHQDGGPTSTGVCYEAERKILVVELDGAPADGSRAVLAFDFRGVIQNEAEGLFRSSIAPDKWVLATNLHPFYARRLFPCFDEPEFKATFDLTIDHSKGTTVLSNTRLQKQDPLVFGSRRSTFERTPRMSSHLLSFTVGEFMQFEPDACHNGVKIAIHAPIGWAIDAPQILEKAVEAYAAASEFFADIPQPMRKIDIVAAKSGHHGMKNWGIIFVNRDLWAAGARMAMPNDWHCAVIDLMKEMLRFWLGNLVTMQWWDDLWLMEGLAGYLASELTSRLDPEIGSEVYTLIDTTVSALNDDDNPRKAHPIKDVRLMKADEIVASYDSLTYKKSEAILRMFSNYVGKEKFHSSIHDFIQSHAYMLVKANIWWARLAKNTINQGGVITKANVWTRELGYPTINVSIKKNELCINQKSKLGSKYNWAVPISYQVQESDKFKYESEVFVLFVNEQEFKLPRWFIKKNGPWVLVNSHYEGYYRVVYSNELKDSLINAVRELYIEEIDLLQLLNDFYAEGKASGTMTYFKNLVESISQELNDGVILLLTRIMTEFHAIEPDFASSGKVTTIFLTYHYRHGGVKVEPDSNLLRQYTRRQVTDYLTNKLNDPCIKKDMQGLT